MSLILGAHLLRKLYLASDTRVTAKRANGLLVVRDDLIKFFDINDRIGAVAAGHAALAAFTLKRLKERVGEGGHFSDLEAIVTSEQIDEVVREYVNVTGRVEESIGLIMAGHNAGSGKQAKSARLGQVMSAILRRIGEGARVEQTVDPAIIDALEQGLSKSGKLEADDLVNLEVPSSRMLSMTIVTEPHSYRIERKPVELYEYALYHPDQGVKTVQVPDELLSHLEFRAQKDEGSLTNTLYEDARTLIKFALDQIREKAFTTAGGHILTVLVTLEGAIFPTGELAQVRDGRAVNIGGIRANPQGELVYALGDGVEYKYRRLAELNEQAETAAI